MKKILVLVYVVVGCFFEHQLCGWATPEQNADHVAKPKVNLLGSMKTHQGNRWEHIENITIDGKYMQIQMLVAPATVPLRKINELTGKDEIILKDDPYGRPGYTTIKIDLAEIKTIESVPNLLYIYKGTALHVTNYFELIVTPKDSSIKPYHCLVLETVKVKWDEKSTAGQANTMETPIGSVALLEIKDVQPQEIKEPVTIK